jgi:hypothetical protein
MGCEVSFGPTLGGYHSVHIHKLFLVDRSLLSPKPYPANLMVGYYAFADSTKPVRTDLDNELVGMFASHFTGEPARELTPPFLP